MSHVESSAKGHEISGSPPSSQLVLVVVTTLVVVLAFFQNLYRIGVAPVLTDEPIYAQAGWRYVHGQVFPPGLGGGIGALADNFEHPPLAKYLFGLAQLVAGNPSITATRVVAATATLLTAVAVGWWVSRLRGRWLGLACGAAVALIPVHVEGTVVRFGRYGMLDPVAELFMVLSVIAAWHWMRGRGADAWRWAIGTGVLVGVAASAKENASLGVLGPTLVLLGEATLRGTGVVRRLARSAAAVGLAVVVFFATYLPLGAPAYRIRYLVETQLRHSELGHPVGFAGRVAAHPPWWTNLWFAGHGWTWPLTVALLIGAVGALVLLRDRVTAWCVAALTPPIIFHCFIAGVALPFYWTTWTPFFYVLATSGLVAIVMRGLAFAHVRGRQIVVVAPILTLLVLVALPDARQLAALHRRGAQEIASVMSTHGLKGPVIVAGLTPVEVRTYLAHVRITNGTGNPGKTDTVVLGKPRCRVSIDRSKCVPWSP